MKHVISFYLLSAFVVGETVDKSCECGVSKTTNISHRIVGGTSVLPHQYPWVVALIYRSKLRCGGAIITDNHILTAGHCISFGVIYSNLTVFIGIHDKYNGSHKTISLSNGVKHPSFSSNAVRDLNDIAVLTLDKRIKFSDTVRPICLPLENLNFDEMELIVAGWGRTENQNATSRFLLQASVKIIDSRKCMRSSIYSKNIDKNTMLCAAAVGKDACQGDSGGPLFGTHPTTKGKKWYQVAAPMSSLNRTRCFSTLQFGRPVSKIFCHGGLQIFGFICIVSWGIDCALPEYPGVYTAVSKYLTWIKQMTADGVYCE